MIEQLIPFLFIGAAAVFVLVGMLRSRKLAKQRLAAMEALANELGLNWFKSGTPQEIEGLIGFNLFNQGRARQMSNLIEGVTDEVRICIFDYQFTTGHGKHQRNVRQTVASLSSARLSCPQFSMRPEGIFDSVGGMLGFQDIDFDSHPEFSRLFVLKGSNEEAIRNFFQQPVLEFFETQSGISVEGKGNAMCFFRAGKMIPPDQITDLLSDAYRVYGCLVDE